jgi:hypothetical protein
VRILQLAHPGTNSRDIFLDTESGFREAGHEVIRWELEPMLALASSQHPPEVRTLFARGAGEMVRRLIEANRVDLTVGLWANGLFGMGVSPDTGSGPRSFFNQVNVPHAMFWLDAPHWAHNGQIRQHFGSPLFREPQLINIINNPGTAREMTEVLGFGRTLAEPYGVNTEVFRPATGVACAHDVVVNVGPGDPAPTETMLRELGSDDPDLDAIRRDLAPGAIESMRRQAAEAGLTDPAIGALVEAWVESQLDEPGRPLLDRLGAIAADGEMAGALEQVRACPALFVGMGESARTIDRFRRAFTVTWLSRRLDVAVFGPDALAGWPHGATMLGAMDYRAMSGAYAKGRLAINVMRWQDDVGLNIKPLEITASGVACLCERRSGLDGLFEVGEEIDAFDSPADLLAKARALLADTDRRTAMASAGLARTRRDHTWARWAASVCDFAQGRSGTGADATAAPIPESSVAVGDAA